MTDLYEALRKYGKINASNEPVTGVVVGIDGKRVDLKCPGHSMILRNVPVNGDVTAMSVGDNVSMTWSNGAPRVNFTVTKEVCPISSELSFSTWFGVNGPINGVNGLNGLDGINGQSNPSLIDTNFWGAIGQPGDEITTINQVIVVDNVLYVVGEFTKIGGIEARNSAYYNISNGSWTALSISEAPLNSVAYYNGRLYVAGDSVWEWDGGSWVEFPVAGTVTKLASSEYLYAAGVISSIGGANGNSLFKYNGSFWSSMGYSAVYGVTALSVLSSGVYAFVEVYDYGASTKDFILSRIEPSEETVTSGTIDQTDKVNCIGEYGGNIFLGGKLLGGAMRVVDNGLAYFEDNFFGEVKSIVSTLDAMYVAGDFDAHGYNIFEYRGGEFYVEGETKRYAGGVFTELDTGLNDACNSIALANGNVYAAGKFTTAGRVEAKNAAVYMPNLYNFLAFLYNFVPDYEDERYAVYWGKIKGVLSEQADLLMALNNKVSLNGEETIAGVKTFLDFPITPEESPTSEYQVVNKKYVDGRSISVEPFRFVVSDSSGSPSSNPMWYYDETLGLVYFGREGGANLVTGDAVLSLLAKGDEKTLVVPMYSWGDGPLVNPTIASYRSRGTRLSPAALMSGDRLLNIGGFGYDGASWTGSFARIILAATEDFSPSSHGAAIYMDGTPRGSVSRRRFIAIDEDGVDIPSGSYKVNGVPLSGGGATLQRSLTSNMVLFDGDCLVLVGYINLKSHNLQLSGDAELKIL